MDIEFLLSLSIKSLTTWIYILLFAFIIFFKRKKMWIYDSLYSLGMMVGIIGVMICLYNKLLDHYSYYSDIPRSVIEIFCNVSHIFLIVFLLIYKPKLYGKSNIMKSVLLLFSICIIYLVFNNPNDVYIGIPMNSYLNFSCAICLLIYFLYNKIPM